MLTPLPPVPWKCLSNLAIVSSAVRVQRECSLPIPEQCLLDLAIVFSAVRVQHECSLPVPEQCLLDLAILPCSASAALEQFLRSKKAFWA